MVFNIIVEITCNHGRIVNAEAYGGEDIDAYFGQRGFVERIDGATHPTYRHRNGLTALSIISRCKGFDASQELTALIRRIGVVATDVKRRRRSRNAPSRPAVTAAKTAMDGYLEGILAKCGS